MGNCLKPKRGSFLHETQRPSSVTTNSLSGQQTSLILSERSSPKTMVLGADDNVEIINRTKKFNSNKHDKRGSSTGKLKIVLVPHQHTLFCERKVTSSSSVYHIVKDTIA